MGEEPRGEKRMVKPETDEQRHKICEWLKVPYDPSVDHYIVRVVKTAANGDSDVFYHDVDNPGVIRGMVN